jgi:NADH-quinone oxidoreductase subunit B
MEVKRELIGTRPSGGKVPGKGGAAAQDLRVKSLNPSQLLRGADLEGANHPAHLEGTELERYVEERMLTTTLDQAVAWARSNAFFPLAFGLACCAMEQFHAAGPRMDIGRFGFEAFRASPRQADLIILAGRVSIKMAPIIRRLYDQMLEPKWAISMGACCSSMGVFNNYALVPADKFMPIDVHVPGCPPRPESLMHGVLKLRKMIQDDPDMGWRDRYDARGTEEVVPGTPAEEVADGMTTAPQDADA